MEFKEYMQIIGENIRVARKSKNLSRKDLDRKIHITQQYIGKVERGEANPTLEILHKIAVALETSIPSLIGDYPDKLGALMKKYRFSDKSDIYKLLSALDSLDKDQIDLVIKMITGLKK